jgi:transcriptional regulator with XRE-family HTH domain
MHFSERIKDLRSKHKLNQTDLGNILNVGQRQISYYEKGNDIPQLPALIRLSDFFCVSLDYLVGRSDDPRHEEYLYKAEEALLGEMIFNLLPNYYKDPERRNQNYSTEKRLKIIFILREILKEHYESIVQYREIQKSHEPTLLNEISKRGRYHLQKLGLIEPTHYIVDLDERDKMLQRSQELSELLHSGISEEDTKAEEKGSDDRLAKKDTLFKGGEY